MLLDQGTLSVIPNDPTRKRRHPFDPLAYRMRNLIERAFCRLRDWRRIAIRYDHSPQLGHRRHLVDLSPISRP